MLKAKQRSNIIEGPIFTGLIKFVIPMILTGVLQIMYNMADSIVVGKLSGDYAALGAIGSTTSLNSLITNFMIGISAGAGVVIAQFYGAKNEKEVSGAVHTSSGIAIIGGLIFMFIGLFLSGPILKLMGTKDAFFENARLYMRIISIGVPATSIYNFGASILRSVGDSKTPLYILAASSVTNVGLNLFFVLCFDTSIAGVAIATVISQYLSAIAVVWILIKNSDECYGIDLKKLKIENRYVKRILRLGLPMAFQSLLFNLSNVIFTSAVNTFEPVVVEAKTIAFSIGDVTYTAMNAFSNAVITFIGQNYGAGKFARINKTFYISIIQVVMVGVGISVVEVIFGRQLSMLYIDANNPETERIIAAVFEIFKYFLIPYFLCGIMEVISGILKALAYSISSMIASLIGLAVRVLWVLFVFPLERFNSIPGLFVAYGLSWIVTIIISLLFCAGAWRKLEISKKAKAELAPLN